MREVAVTCGDRVEAEIAWLVDQHIWREATYICEEQTRSPRNRSTKKMEEYKERYTIATDNIDAIRY